MAAILVIALPSITTSAYTYDNFCLDEVNVTLIVLPDEYFVPLAIYQDGEYIGTIMRLPDEYSQRPGSRASSIPINSIVNARSAARLASFFLPTNSTFIGWRLNFHTPPPSFLLILTAPDGQDAWGVMNAHSGYYSWTPRQAGNWALRIFNDATFPIHVTGWFSGSM